MQIATAMPQSRITQLVIATHNPGKLAEIEKLLAPIGIAVTSVGVLGLPEPEETGDSFIANATLKARAAAQASGLPALADDSGLVVPALGGAPGIYSARWAGPDKNFTHAMRKVEAGLSEQGIASAEAEASFCCVLTLAEPSGVAHSFEGSVSGHLHFPPRGGGGFGYDPIFIPDGYTLSFAEMDASEKAKISHRSRAFSKFVDWLRAQNSL